MHPRQIRKVSFFPVWAPVTVEQCSPYSCLPQCTIYWPLASLGTKEHIAGSCAECHQVIGGCDQWGRTLEHLGAHPDHSFSSPSFLYWMFTLQWPSWLCCPGASIAFIRTEDLPLQGYSILLFASCMPSYPPSHSPHGLGLSREWVNCSRTMTSSRYSHFPWRYWWLPGPNPSLGTSLVTQWLRLYIPDAIAPRVLPLIRELDPTHHH